MRIGGSRVDPLLGAVLAAADAGALELPACMVEGRARLASLQQVAGAQTAPRHEETARREAVQRLLADPAEDVVTAVLEGRQADDEHRLRADLLAEAVEAASDTANVLPADWHVALQRAHARCISRLKGAFSTFSQVSVDPADLWGSPQPVTSAWTSFTRGAADYELLVQVHRVARAGSPAERDLEGLFSEVQNMDHVWPERISSLRPLSTLVQPWPARSNTLGWLVWVHQVGGTLYLPSREQQDSEWGRVFGARSSEFAAGRHHLGQMRETFG